MSAKLVPTSADRECRMVSATVPAAINLDFLDPEPLLFHSDSSSVILTRLSGPHSRRHYSENLVAPGIEPRTSGSVARRSEY
jgi:hypothetical protein